MTQTPWRIVADEVATCNCAWGCPCQFNALPTHGRCEALVAVRIREGHYGATSLDGLTYAAAYWWPGAIHEGQGIAQLAMDEKATEEQRTALVNICSGREGGEFRAEPIVNPVTGEEHPRVTLGSRTFSNRNSYAQFAAVDWTNA